MLHVDLQKTYAHQTKQGGNLRWEVLDPLICDQCEGMWKIKKITSLPQGLVVTSGRDLHLPSHMTLWSHGHMRLRDKLKKRYVSLSTWPMATERYRVVTYYDGLLHVK